MFFWQREGGPIAHLRLRLLLILLLLLFLGISFIYLLLFALPDFKCVFFLLPLPFPFSIPLHLPLPCYYSANIKDAAAHWVTQSAACQAAVHEVTWQLIWQVPCRPGTSPSLPHLLLILHLVVVVFSITHT